MSDCSNPQHQHGAPCEKDLCSAIGYQTASVCIPVEIAPFAKPGTVKVSCYGEPVITPGCDTCPGERNGTCAFTLCQTICVEVPVYFGAATKVGDAHVACDTTCCEEDYDVEEI